MIISAKYNRKMPSGLEPSFICGASLSFFSLEHLVEACTTVLCSQVSQRAMSTSKWIVFEQVDLAHSEKLPFHQGHLKQTNRRTLNLLMLGSLVAGVTPLACLQDLPRHQSCCHSGLLLCSSLSQIGLHIQMGAGTCLFYGHSIQTAY